MESITKRRSPRLPGQSIRLILALASIHDLELHQMDVGTAFLYGSLDEQVFMEQPEGFKRGEDIV